MNLSKTLVLIGLVGSNAADMPMSLRRVHAKEVETAKTRGDDESPMGDVDHLDLEVNVNGERQLFPLLPGTKCPTGHTCRTRTASRFGTSP